MAKTTCCCSDCYAKCMTAPAYPANLRWTQRCVRDVKHSQAQAFASTTWTCIGVSNMHACMPRHPSYPVFVLPCCKTWLSATDTHTCIDTDKNSQASNGSGWTHIRRHFWFGHWWTPLAEAIQQVNWVSGWSKAETNLAATGTVFLVACAISAWSCKVSRNGKYRSCWEHWCPPQYTSTCHVHAWTRLYTKHRS